MSLKTELGIHCQTKGGRLYQEPGSKGLGWHQMGQPPTSMASTVSPSCLIQVSHQWD